MYFFINTPRTLYKGMYILYMLPLYIFANKFYLHPIIIKNEGYEYTFLTNPAPLLNNHILYITMLLLFICKLQYTNFSTQWRNSRQVRIQQGRIVGEC